MKISLIFLILSNYWLLSLFLFWGYLPTKTIADRSENIGNVSIIFDNRTEAIIIASNSIPHILKYERIDPMALIYDLFPETKVLQNKDISKFYDPNALGSNVGLFEHPIGVSTKFVFEYSWLRDRSIPVDNVRRRVNLYLKRLKEFCQKIVRNYEANDSRVRLGLTPDMIKLDHEIYQNQPIISDSSSYRVFYKSYEPSREKQIEEAVNQIDGILRFMKINPSSSIYDVIPITKELKNNPRLYKVYDSKLFNETIDIFKLPIGQTTKMAFDAIWKHDEFYPVNYVETRVQLFVINLKEMCQMIAYSINKPLIVIKFALKPDIINSILRYIILPVNI